MKLLVLAAALALTGCTTVVPVKQPFPVAPAALLERCPDLLTIDDGKNSMRDMLKVVIQNYALYYQCAEKTHGWQDWYGQQKKIFNSAGK
jgi:hypothetical protein